MSSSSTCRVLALITVLFLQAPGGAAASPLSEPPAIAEAIVSPDVTSARAWT